jgi:hypothetical protein
MSNIYIYRINTINNFLDYYKDSEDLIPKISVKTIISRGSVNWKSQVSDGKSFLPVVFDHLFSAPFAYKDSTHNIIVFNDNFPANMIISIIFSSKEKNPKFYFYKNNQIISYGAGNVLGFKDSFKNGDALMLSVLLNKGSTVSGAITFVEDHSL